MESRDISAQVLQVAGERGSAPVDLVDPADVLARADVMLITYLDAGKPAKSLIDFSVEKRGRMLYCTARYPPPDDRVLFQRELPLSAPELAKGAAGRAFVVLAIAQSSRCLIAQEHATVESQSRFDDLYSCLTDMSKKVKAEKAHSRETAMLGMSDVADESFNQFIKALDEVGRVHLVLPYLPEALKNVLLNDNPRMTSISETRRLGRN